MSQRSIQYENRKSRSHYTQKQAAAYLEVSMPTFIRYRELLGIEPRRKRLQKGNFYLHEELLDILEVLVAKRKKYDYSVEQCYKNLSTSDN